MSGGGGGRRDILLDFEYISSQRKTTLFSVSQLRQTLNFTNVCSVSAPCLMTSYVVGCRKHVLLFFVESVSADSE